jgi:transcriptional regulator with XRE-family HTH domain
LSYRQAAARAGLSHSTIYDIINGARPSADTIKKLAAAFSNDGYHYKRALEIALLYRCGYLLAEPEITLSEPVARLVDKIGPFTTDQLELMVQFADYIAKVGNAEPR